MLIASFVFFLIIFIGVGIWASRGREHTDEDYMLAGRDVHPALTALSAAATRNSGFMFIAFIGLAYAQGVHALWLPIGFMIGDFLMSFLVYPKVKRESVERNAFTFPELISRWGGKKYPYVRIVGALLTVLLLSIYAAAQLQAGGKALSVMLGWGVGSASLIGGIIILSYCLVGGLRASIWTDGAQSVVMLLAMGLLLGFCVAEVGGVNNFITQVNAVAPTYSNIFPTAFEYFSNVSGTMLFILGWIIGGIGTIGQPHIMVRYMSMRSADEMLQVRLYSYSWDFVFSLLALGVGLGARILLPEVANFDAELGLPTLALQLMPAVLAGAILAGVFSSALSTADSQVLSCSAALTHDFSAGDPHPSFRTDEIATGLVVLLIIFISAFGNSFAIGGFSVFSLVLLAWSGLAVTFGPVLIVFVLGGRPTQITILLMMAVGFITNLLWQQTPLSGAIYSVLPGFIAAFATYAIDLAFRQGNTQPGSGATA